MKLLRTSEPKMSQRHRTADVLGTPEQGAERIFDPERDIPEAFRQQWVQAINEQGDAFQKADFAFYFLVTFPHRRGELDLKKLGEQVKPEDCTADKQIQLLLIFPEKAREIQANFLKKYAPDLTQARAGLRLAERARIWSAAQALQSDIPQETKANMNLEWEGFVLDLQGRDYTKPSTIRVYLPVLTSTRLMFPDRFEEVGLLPADIKNIKQRVMTLIKRWVTQAGSLGLPELIGNLAIITADTITLQPGVGITVEPAATKPTPPKELPPRNLVG